MASDSSDTGRSASGDQGQASHEPRECMACRGTGKVISNLGGAPSQIACPWCEGGGARLPGVDAQARWRERDDARDGERSPASEPAA